MIQQEGYARQLQKNGKSIRDSKKDTNTGGKISNEINIRERVFLISGTNFSQRRQAIENIKKRILKEKATSLDACTFYSKEINVRDLSGKLFTTSFEEAKIIVFKNFQDLPAVVRNFLFENLKKILASNYLIFETDKDYYQFQKNKKFTTDKFFNFVFKKAALLRTASIKEKNSIEDFMGSIRKNDLAASVYILEKLFKGDSKDKILGPQIIGILVQKFSFLKNSAEKERCFKYLWEADRAIKEKGLDPRLVIETFLARVFVPH